MITIRLRKGEWLYDPSAQLGPEGGFGAVFLGTDLDGNEVAVKRLKIQSESTGHRELLIAEELGGRDLAYVIPIFDSGIDAESGRYFVVMAKADKSLQDDLNGGPLSEAEAVGVLTQIAQGIAEIGGLVHRDLKPGNILHHQGVWKLADFGIARFVEKTTSLNTLRNCLSRHYAAPEQWRLERATNATDVYAFGCIGYALLEGNPPFTSGDLRRKHLQEQPPLAPASARVQQLISLCLRKSPKARPSIGSVQRQLESIRNASMADRSIAAAGAAVAEEEARREAEAARERTEYQEREELAQDAVNQLDLLLDSLFRAITDAAPVAIRVNRNEVVLGSGRLTAAVVFPVLAPNTFPRWRKDIVSGAVIHVVQRNPRYRGRSANLWFGQLENAGEWRWWEIPYFSWAAARRSPYDPFGIETKSGLEDADLAGGPVTHSVQLAAKPVPIDREHTDEFINRWSKRLAAASRNALSRPSTLPEK